MTGDGIVVRLFLLAVVAAPLLSCYLYVTWQRESQATVRHLRAAVLGALLAASVAALVGVVAFGSQANNALYGAMIFVGFYGIPTAIVGAIVGAIVSSHLRPK